MNSGDMGPNPPPPSIPQTHFAQKIKQRIPIHMIIDFFYVQLVGHIQDTTLQFSIQALISNEY